MVVCQVDVSETEAKEIRATRSYMFYVFLCNYDNYEMDRWKMFDRGADFFSTPGRKMLVAGQDVKKRKNPKSRQNFGHDAGGIYGVFSTFVTACSFSLAMEDKCV